MKWLFRWLFESEISDSYLRGWSDGVLQHMYDDESCHPIRWIHGESWPTYNQYWGNEE